MADEAFHGLMGSRPKKRVGWAVVFVGFGFWPSFVTSVFCVVET